MEYLSLEKAPDLIILGSVLGLAPFFIISLTCFVKVSIVLALVRNALGIQQIPPNMVIYGLAFMLTAYIMAPIFLSMYQLYTQPALAQQPVEQKVLSALPPLENFLAENTDPINLQFFEDATRDLWKKKKAPSAKAPSTKTPSTKASTGSQPPAATLATPALSQQDESIIEDIKDVEVLSRRLSAAPAFLISEIKDAFEIGFLIYIPFIAIDLIISNILLSLGMMMVSPTVISLPFKLFLFVSVDGWGRLVKNLILSYS